jgi:trimethylamine---corrinoid protein Co-methyltransferase
MARKGFVRKFPPLEILSKEDVEQIKKATLDILKETGMTIEHDEALHMLEKNDCIVDYEKKRARFPEGLVNECLRRCPSTFRVKARDPENDIIFGGNTVYFKSSPGMDIIDPRTGDHRTATKQEYIDAVRVLDALANHDWFSCYTPYFGYMGVPEVMKMTMGFVQRLKYSSKFTGLCFANYNWDFNFRIAKAAGCEIMCPAFMVSSPLVLSEFAVEAGFKTIEYGFPVGVDTGSVMGATAPATIAGGIAEFNAELIGGIVLAQLKKPYSRVFVWGFPNPQNMRTGAPNFGNVANSLFNVANNQIWRDYAVPLRNTASVFSNAKTIDFQSGVEHALPAILSAISGASSIHLFGGAYGEIAHSPVQSILEDDLAGMIGRFVEGVTVDDETLALDLIHEVGPVPGHFLDKKHTYKWWQMEQYLSKSADVLTYPEWERAGKKDCIDYAEERMKKILAEHEVSVKLTDEQEEDIKQIVRELHDFYVNKGDLKD